VEVVRIRMEELQQDRGRGKENDGGGDGEEQEGREERGEKETKAQREESEEQSCLLGLSVGDENRTCGRPVTRRAGRKATTLTSGFALISQALRSLKGRKEEQESLSRKYGTDFLPTAALQ